MKKEFGNPCISTSRSCTNLPTTTFELLQTQGTRLKIPHQGITTTNQFRAVWNQKDDEVAGARETWAVSSATNGIQCLSARDLDTMPGNAGSQSGLKTTPEQADWLEDTDEEIDEQELEAHYSYMEKIQEVSPAESSLLITPLETGKTKKVFKAIKESEASLTQELKECKTNLDESSRLGGATSSRDSSLIALQTKQTGCLRRVIHSTSISRPQLKCYQVKEKVMPNISQVKFTKKEVEDHHRISSISKKTKSVTACNDSFKTPIVQLILFIVDSGCTKHMTGNLKLLCNFVEKFLGTVRFGNDQFAPILGLGR
ncbi:hypothetical protein Tco_1302999 [Tanacetum coccineum]